MIGYVNGVNASADKVNIKTLIKAAYGLDLSAVNSITDLTSAQMALFANKTLGILYDETGTLRDITGVMAYYEAVIGYVNGVNASTDKANIKTLIKSAYGLDLSAVNSINDLTKTQMDLFNLKAKRMLE